MNVSRPTLPVTELSDPLDLLSNVGMHKRTATLTRHVFLNGFSSTEQTRMAAQMKAGLFQPVWFANSESTANQKHNRWQSRWSRIGNTPVNSQVLSRLANLAVAIWSLGEPEAVTQAFALRHNNELRTQLITQLASANCDPATVLEQIRSTSDPGIRQAFILSLGEFGAQAISERARADYLSELQSKYLGDRSASIRAAVNFIVRRWKENLPASIYKELTKQTSQHARNEPLDRKAWRTAQHGEWIRGPRALEFAVLETPNPLPGNQQDRENYAPRFGIGLRPISHERFGVFAEEVGLQRATSSAKKPAQYVSYYDAARYCNWLSQEAEIPRNEWCFKESNADDGRMEAVPDYLSKRGFRLPTVAEWRLACGGGARTRFPWGESDKWSDQYAWVSSNSRLAKTDIGLKKPNWCGLFDITGNVSEWVRHNEGGWNRNNGFACGAHRHEQRWLHHTTALRYEPKTTADFTIGFRVAITLD